MVISADEKKILLERLQKARETKAAKAAEAKKAKAAKETPASVKEPEPPAPAPAPAPEPVPEPVPEPIKPAPSEPIDIPAVPDLVAMSKKKPAKKKKVESSDESASSDSEAELPPKKGKGGKKQAYMKIKIYKEPKNAVAFQSLVEAIQDEQPEPEPAPEPIPQAAVSIGRGCKFDIKNKTPAQSRTLPTPQELMRRAALEFFG